MSRSFNKFIDQSTHELLMALKEGTPLADAMRDATRNHVERLRTASELERLAADGCPRCHGRIVHGTTIARCLAGCGFIYRVGETPEPIASSRADQ